ncbi:MBL fold metallo-hydrolase [Kyrpidia spormannii]|uniref:MBL fold metallo-hydrolase n=1 Tax=Kyrpidia spormannii TaxID=2055160 RepID=A0A6F9E2F4_9BACL|nr:MBL fold metallo-hydrolase [Kyrpidia spormannii]CAB3390565.1 MBL fold metallo-hydrolase [Kyrpidia spormannii]
MIFRQYLHENPVAASYLFGCGTEGQGAVVDPVDDVEFYVREAERAGLNIRYVFDTHLHADHISGGRRLAERTGASYVLHRSADVRYTFHPVEDGDVLFTGNTRIQIIHTPGHTPEHISLLVSDLRRADAPWFVLTGHTLMVGDAGRTELASSLEEGARDLYHSLFEKLMKLNDQIEVYPGAYSGSVCGRFLSGKPSSTIGFERRFNVALQARSLDEFIAFMTQDIPPKPSDYERIRLTNAGQ